MQLTFRVATAQSYAYACVVSTSTFKNEWLVCLSFKTMSSQCLDDVQT